MKRHTLIALALALAAPLKTPADEAALNFESDGTAIIENSLLQLRVSNRPGRNNGICGWFFKPTGYEMVDVLYRQLDAGGGHLLGMLWDSSQFGAIGGGAPQYGDLFVPRIAEVANDGSAITLRQVTKGAYELTRTLILRRDHAVVEAHYKLVNKMAPPSGFALRLHNVLSPGARGQYASRDDIVALAAAAGAQTREQGLPLDVFLERYQGDTALVDGYQNEAPNMWTRHSTNKVTRLARPFMAQYNPENGDGLVFMGNTNSLIGFYNCPGITIEPLFRPVVLTAGASWETTIYLAACGALGREPLLDATPLYAVLKAPTVDNGHLSAKLIPFFKGNLQVVSSGKIVQNLKADVLAPLEVAAIVGDDWVLVACDSQGCEIGRTQSGGSVELAAVTLTEPSRKRPRVRGNIYSPARESAKIKDFIAKRDFAVQCDANASEPVRELARTVALRLGVGLATTPRYTGKMVAFGSAERSTTIRNLGLLKNSFDAEWPGKGRGAIVHYDNFEATGQPILAVGGSDPQGAYLAAQDFYQKYVATLPAAKGYDLWVKPLSAIGMVWDRPLTSEHTDKIAMSAARGEYECAQVMLTAYEPLANIVTSLDPLIHTETGTEISRSYITAVRRRHGPLLLRWAALYPQVEYDGWPGNYDGLLRRGNPTQEAGISQVLWLTAMVSKEAIPGSYTSALHVVANSVTSSIPIKLTVHDFTLPDTGLQGAAYMAMHLMADDGYPRAFQVDRLISALVEHRFRKVTLSEPGMLHYQVSKEGAFKGIDAPSLLANDDGTLLLETSRFDWLIERCDLAAKPFELSFTVPFLDVVGWSAGALHDFMRIFPDRFANLPPRTGHPVNGYWAQEMATLFKRHLERRGDFARVKVKVGDEPAGFDTWWYQGATAAREAGLHFTTAFNSIDWEQARKALGTSFADFEPLYQRFDPDFAAAAQAAGTAMGWYNCGPPQGISMSAPPSALRSYYWQAARYNLDFVARWGVQCWGTEGTSPYNVWTFRGSQYNSLLYPEHPDKPAFTLKGVGWVDTAPLDSIRFDLVRDGIEDADYVRVLRAAIAAAKEAGLNQEAQAAATVLEAIWSDLFPSLNQYRPPYAELMRRREQIAQTIVNLQNAVKQSLKR